MRPIHRSLTVLAAVGIVLTGCSSPGASSAWSYGPSLAPAASGSAAPSASTAPSAPASAAPSASASAAASAPAPSAPSASPGGETTSLTIGTKTGDELEFDPDEVSVPAGTQVSVTFENRAALPHNLTFGEPINVATSPVVAAGASETIEFTAPAPGDYTFNCTIHPGMQGTLTVETAG
jgi:plastocyanin